MRLLITDLTVMHGGNFCVAGWDLDAHRMVRPLPEGHHWTADLVDQYGIEPGVLVGIALTGRPHSGVYPHLTEDAEVDPASIQVIDRRPYNWFGPDAPTVDASIDAIFSGAIQFNRVWNRYRKGCFVRKEQNVRSLGAVIVHRDWLEPYEDEYEGRNSLRVKLYDGTERYDIPVVDSTLRACDTAVDVNRYLPRSGRLHVRVGLARAWEKKPDQCTLMLNGIRW